MTVYQLTPLFFLFFGCGCSVPGGSDTQAPEDENRVPRESRCDRGCVLGLDPRVFDRRGSRARRERKQRFEGEENHAEASSARHPRGRRTRHSHQGHHRRRRSHTSHPQIPHQQDLQGMNGFLKLGLPHFVSV